MAATAETIMGCIEHRVGDVEMQRLRNQYGDRVVEDALYEAGVSHSGCDEIGSSDIYYMVQSFKRFLGNP